MSISNEQLERLMPQVMKGGADLAEKVPDAEVDDAGVSGSALYRGELVDPETGKKFSWLLYAMIASNEAPVVSVLKKLRPKDKPGYEGTP